MPTTFSGERPPEAGFFESVTRIAGEHGFTLNRRKTRLQKLTSRQTVTGIVTNQKLNVDREYKLKLRAQLHTLDPPGPIFSHLQTLPDPGNSAFYCKSVSPHPGREEEVCGDGGKYA